MLSVPSLEAIAETEAAVGARFPEPYKIFLAAGNAGPVYVGPEVWYFFPVLETTAKELDEGTVIAETTGARCFAGFPPDAVAIAANDYGELLIIAPGASGPMVWHSDAENVAPAALSFDDLLLV